MTLQQLYYVIIISETKSLNKAAELLYIAQPSLTSAIKELEKELGIPIFRRGGKGVSLTNDGAEFLLHARQIYHQYEMLLDKYGRSGTLKKKFGVSTQHYSFVVKAFVDMVKHYNIAEYEFAIRETKTLDIIDDVNTLKSEVGILYLSDFNRKIITKLLNVHNLEFHSLIECAVYVYLWKGHPLACCDSISFSQLADYPCLSFEQGDNSSFYFAEEIFSANEYPRIIKACDRATMLNLMIGINGYTFCSGIICEELNGTDFTAVPFKVDSDLPNNTMEIGYIVKKNMQSSEMAKLFIDKVKQYLE